MRWIHIINEESEHIREYALLLETPQRAAWLLQNFGEKLEGLYTQQVEQHAIAPNIQQAIESQEPEGLAAKIISYIMAADPTPNKSYSRWIALRYIKGGQRLEDVNGQLAQNLSLFQRAAAARRVDANLDAIRTFADLFAVVEPFVVGDREVSGKADRKAGRVTKADDTNRQWGEDDPMRTHADVLYDGDDYMILIPKDAEAACYFGKNTNWCTTTTMFNYYNDRDPLYIILRRRDSRRWQFHFESSQFMDERDRSIDLPSFINENPKVFEVIGSDKLIPQIGKLRIPISALPENDIADVPIDILAKAVFSTKDLSVIPKQVAQSKEFLERLIPFIVSGWAVSEQDPEGRNMIAAYTKIFPDPVYWEWLCLQHRNLFSKLPQKYQTDEAKIATSRRLSWDEIARYIPKPWPKEVEKDYWNNRSRLSPEKLSPDIIPEEFLTDEVLTPVLALHPSKIPAYDNRLTPEICSNMLNKIINDTDQVVELTKNLPKKFLTKDLQDQIYSEAKTLTGTSDREERNNYLRAMIPFPRELWPWKAPKVSNIMALLNEDFYSNPEQFQTVYFAEKWAAEHPYQLYTLKKEHVSQQVVTAALSHKDNYRHDFYELLRACDDNIVLPEYVENVIESVPALRLFWHNIPNRFLTNGVIDKLVSVGAIPLDDDRFPQRAHTVDNVALRISVATPATHKEKDGGYGTKDVPNERAMVQWGLIPHDVDKPKVLAALLKINTKFGWMIGRVDKKNLTTEVLTTWVNAIKPYDRDDGREFFKRFPKSSYTPEALATAVAKNVIQKVPSTLRNDDAIIAMLKNPSAKSNINWKQVTPAVFEKFIDESPPEALSSLRYTVPATHPIQSNPNVHLLLLKKRDEQPESGYLYRRIENKDLSELWGDHPERRTKWTQQHYDFTAGNVVPIEEVPPKFRNDVVYKRAWVTNPETAKDDAARAWILKHNIELPEFVKIKIMVYGLLQTPKGVIDMTKTKHQTVNGVKGSYIVEDLSKGKALFIFDEDGDCVNALYGTVSSSNNKESILASNVGSNSTSRIPMGSMMPYRLLIADAFKKHPELMSVFPNRGYWGHDDIRSLNDIHLYEQGGVYIPLEKLDRKPIDGTSIYYVLPDKRGYHDQIYYLFASAQGGGAVANIVLSEDGRGVKCEGAALSMSKMPKLLEISKDIAQFLHVRNVVSGNSEKFKNGPLYQKLGIRGPGRYEWYSILEAKIAEQGSFKAWQRGRDIAITDDSLGIVKLGKESKTGIDWKWEHPESPSALSSFVAKLA